MPELPEVETVVNSLKRYVKGAQITSIKVEPLGVKLLGPTSPALLTKAISGSKIEGVTRIGKYIHINLSGASHDLVVHLRMTGKFLFVPKSASEPVLLPKILVNQRVGSNTNLPIRISLRLDNGVLHFLDSRRFATFHLVADNHTYPGIAKLGPDALSRDFNTDYLTKKLNGRTKPIYNALLDQTIVAGLGNIYVCECLALSRIHPLQPAGTLQLFQLEQIVSTAQSVLKEALRHKGTTFRDYAGANGKRGNYQDHLLVYRRSQAVINGTTFEVSRLKIGGRTAHYIKALQTYIE